jgi:hypothetical protein
MHLPYQAKHGFLWILRTFSQKVHVIMHFSSLFEEGVKLGLIVSSV